MIHRSLALSHHESQEFARSLPRGLDAIGCPASPSSPGGAATTFCHCGDHCFTPINRGLTILVSPSDSGLLERRWTGSVGRGGYTTVARAVTVAPKTRKKTVLARAIMLPTEEQEVDHINGDPLDNRRTNLRVCARSQNAKNKKCRKENSVGLKGVRRNRRKFTAYIRSDNKRHYLGSFNTAEEAHAAYVEAAKRLHGEFARAA